MNVYLIGRHSILPESFADVVFSTLLFPQAALSRWHPLVRLLFAVTHITELLTLCPALNGRLATFRTLFIHLAAAGRLRCGRSTAGEGFPPPAGYGPTPMV